MATSSAPKNKSQFWRRYRQNTTAWIATWIFGLILVLAAFSNIVANDRPIAMIYKGHLYAPAFVDYSPADFGAEGFVVDYFGMAQAIEADGWALWPPIRQRPNEPNLNFPELPAPPGATSTLESTAPDGSAVTTEISHPLGTDTAGRDLLTRLVYGCRTSLLMALATTIMALVLGVSIGLAMGYFGGIFDLLVGRLLETLGYFPVIFMIIVLVAFLETPSLPAIIVIFALLGISPFAFYMRGQVLSARKLTYVEAATALGQGPGRIMLNHILPNSFGPIMVLIPFTVTSDISFLATIDFLGFGVQPPTASLGSILRSGFDSIEQRWWLVLYTSVVLVAVLLLVNFIGDGVRDGLDPHATISRREFRKWRAGLAAKEGR